MRLRHQEQRGAHLDLYLAGAAAAGVGTISNADTSPITVKAVAWPHLLLIPYPPTTMDAGPAPSSLDRPSVQPGRPTARRVSKRPAFPVLGVTIGRWVPVQGGDVLALCSRSSER